MGKIGAQMQNEVNFRFFASLNSKETMLNIRFHSFENIVCRDVISEFFIQK